ncbi:RICIN domain-containing protein [Flavobacterium anhuiense]|uniref:RICIN domain-containing protein n=1 Tax=Flavobacterium anhuiense TaxID=459526 RepID=UPI000E6CE43A|nr:RICIN domain-containing protein [Flavobacterium anhuiense]
MKRVKKVIFLFLAIIPLMELYAWPGMPLPPLHVDGKNLKDPCGKNVLLHGVAITPSPWFNGCSYGQCRWDNYNVQGCLNYNNAVMDALTNTANGWKLNYIRLHIDPYWTNTPGCTAGENNISCFDYNRLVTYVNQVIIPLINHARSRGLYVVLRPPGVCPNRIAYGDSYHNYLRTVWQYLSSHPNLKNVDNVMFEIANEPIEILGTNGNWGATGDEHFAALKNFFQDIVNRIRSNGANNVCWIPGTGYQSHYQGYPNHLITGGNIGYAVHVYPGYWGANAENTTSFNNAWNANVQPIANIAPIMITETDWSPTGAETWGTGTTSGFGLNLKGRIDATGNCSWNLLAPEGLITNADPYNVTTAFNNNWEACAAPVKQWFSEYANSNIPSQTCTTLVNNGVYEIEFKTNSNKVVDLMYGTNANGTAIRPWDRLGTTAQQWIAIDAGNGYWRFKSNASSTGRVIDLESADPTNGKSIQLWDNYTNDAQKWLVTDVGNGYYSIKSAVDTTKGWDTSNCNMDGTANLQLWEYYGTSCQLFKFNKIGTTSKSAVAQNISADNIEIDAGVQIYPNPSKGGESNIHFTSESDKEYSLAIYSIGGELVYEAKNLKTNANQTIRTKLRKGIYVARVLQDSSAASKKIVVE